MPDRPELLTTAQLLELLQIGRTKLWELVREGAFPAFRIGAGPNSGLRFRRSDVMCWLERNRVGPQPAEGEPAPREKSAGGR